MNIDDKIKCIVRHMLQSKCTLAPYITEILDKMFFSRFRCCIECTRKTNLSVLASLVHVKHGLSNNLLKLSSDLEYWAWLINSATSETDMLIEHKVNN